MDDADRAAMVKERLMGDLERQLAARRKADSGRCDLCRSHLPEERRLIGRCLPCEQQRAWADHLHEVARRMAMGKQGVGEL